MSSVVLLTHDERADEKRDEAYRYFILSLKRNPSYAPAFTSLGIYYSEFVTPRDPTRASKCFQKAFELDAREGDAARRLADGFAEEREWDLVEVVARRTIEGEGGLDAGLKADGAVGRFLPTNAWAWKAVGVVELVRLGAYIFRAPSTTCRHEQTIRPRSKPCKSPSEQSRTTKCRGFG